MEHSSPIENDDLNAINIIESQIRELYGRTAYSHKAHEKSADIYNLKLKRIKLAQIILSAIITGSLIVALFGEGKLATLIGAIFATLLLGLNAYTKDYNLGEIAQKHVETASRLWNVRESYLSILTDLASGQISLTQIREQRNDLQKQLQAIYQNAPRTLTEAYKQSQQALKVDEELTFSDKEIDVFLPSPLRRSVNEKIIKSE